MNKYLKLLIIMLIFIMYNDTNAVTTDKEPPILKHIELKDKNKTQYTLEDRVYLEIDASDDVSGIKDISLSFTIPLIDGLAKFIGDDWWHGGYCGAGVLYDENNEPYFNIPEKQYNGEYFVYAVTLTDNVGNYVNYQLNYPKSASGIRLYNPSNPKIDTELKYELVGAREFNNDDKIPPEISNYSINKNRLKQGEKLTITVNVKDESLGVKNVSVDIMNNSTRTGSVKNLKETEAGIYTLDYIFDKVGEYTIGPIWATDMSNNSTEKKINDLIVVEEDASYESTEKEYTVYIEDIQVSKNEITPPAYLDVKVKFSPDVDSTFVDPNIVFKNKLGNTLACGLTLNKSSGYYEGKVKINQYVVLGEYYLDEVFILEAGFKKSYIFKRKPENILEKKLDYDIKIYLTSEVLADVTTGTNASNLLKVIEEANDDAKIYIDAKNNSIIKKEVFELIKGTNKIIYIESDGIIWIFNGQDIKEPKDIDVSMNVYFDYDYSNNELGDYVDKALVLDFKDNGVLPGITTVRIKLDYIFKDYIGDKVYVYYYQDKSFETIVDGLLNMNENGFFEFKIDHNSTYILSTNKPDNKFITNKEEIITLNADNIYVEEIKEEQEPKHDEKNDNLPLYMACGSILLLLIVLIIFFIVKNKRD